MSDSLVTGVDFVTLPTEDFEAATDFYGNILGLPCSARYGKMPGAAARIQRHRLRRRDEG